MAKRPIGLLAKSIATLALTLVVAQTFGNAAKVAAAPDGTDVAPPAAMLSGKVATTAPLVAATINLRNIDKGIVYTVFTVHGEYSAPHLFPGRYEVWIDENGLSSDRTQIAIRSGQQATLNLAPRIVPKIDRYIGGRYLPGNQIATYDAIYPPDPKRAAVERSCIACHGQNFLSTRPTNRDGWTAALDYMTSGHFFAVPDEVPNAPPNWITPADREAAIDYLSKYLGEDKPKRVVKEEVPIPRDEAVLGKAMFVEYQFPNPAKGPSRTTQETAFDRSGNVWIVQTHSPGDVIRLDPRTGIHKDYWTPNPGWEPHGLVIDNDETVWWTGGGGPLAHLDPKTGKTDLYPPTDYNEGLSLFFDSKGNIFYSSLSGNRFGKWDRKTNTLNSIRNPSPGGRPYGILVDRQDKVWWIQFHTCKLTRYDPDTGQLTEYPSLSRPCSARRLGLDHAGNIWFGVYSAQKIAKLDPKTGIMTEINVPVPFSNPYDVWVDGNDKIWATSDKMLMRYDPDTGKFAFYPTARQTDIPKMSITKDGAIWFPPRGSSSSGGGLAAAAVLYPDKYQIRTFAAAYHPTDVNISNILQYKGPGTKVTGTGDNGGPPLLPRREDPALGAAAH